MTKNLEFEAVGEWNAQGSNQKDFYISFVAKIDDWKKNIIFYREEIGNKAFNFLLNQALEKKLEKGWKLSVITRGRFMNSIFVSQIHWIEDQWGNKIFEEDEII